MLVKKYGNRRLYDTAESRYITLEELADLVRRGAEPRVLDAKTNEDLTQQTLAQIIVEGRGAARLLPTPLLLQLVRLGDDALAEFFGRYVSWALELYLQAKQGAMAATGISPFGAPTGLGAAFSRMINPFGIGVGGMGTMGAMPNAAPQAPVPMTPAAAAGGAAGADDVAALRRELEALKKSMGGGAKRAPAKKKKA